MSLRTFFADRRVSDERILSAVGAWMLCCAVGAQNKTLSTTGDLDFDTWFFCCRTTWVPKVEAELRISSHRIERVIRGYAERNQHRTYIEVYESEKICHPDRGCVGAGQ